MYPAAQSVGINPLTYVIMVAGVLFWSGVAFYSARKALKEGKDNAFTRLIQQIRDKNAGIFWIVGPAAAALSVLLIGLSIRQISHYEGFGQYMFIGLLSGVASALSLAGALYGGER